MSSVRTLPHPMLGTVRLGRRRPIVRGPSLSLHNYLLRSLPTPPAMCDYFTTATVPGLDQVYLNDTLGDCVIACLAHVSGLICANANPADPPVLYTDAQVTCLYNAVGGYVPGDPATDNGCDIQTALNYWQRNGLLPDGSHKIAGSLVVNPLDPVEVRTAIWLFENVILGLDLPDAWINPAPSESGFAWTVAGPPDPQNGHCVCGVSYDPGRILLDTWGMLGTISGTAISEYCAPENGGELHTVLTMDIISRAKQRAPNGFDWTQLLADFEAIGGIVTT